MRGVERATWNCPWMTCVAQASEMASSRDAAWKPLVKSDSCCWNTVGIRDLKGFPFKLCLWCTPKLYLNFTLNVRFHPISPLSLFNLAAWAGCCWNNDCIQNFNHTEWFEVLTFKSGSDYRSEEKEAVMFFFCLMTGGAYCMCFWGFVFHLYNYLPATRHHVLCFVSALFPCPHVLLL